VQLELSGAAQTKSFIFAPLLFLWYVNVQMDGACVRQMGEKCIHVSGRETRRKEVAWKHKSMWEDNIEKYLKETEWEGVDWIYVVQGGE